MNISYLSYAETLGEGIQRFADVLEKELNKKGENSILKPPLKSELQSSTMVFLSKRKNRKIRLIAVLDMEKIKEYTIFPGMHVTTILTQNSGLI